MIKTRKIILNEDTGAYEGVYGKGDGNWCYGIEALATILACRVRTVRGEILNHADVGVQWFSGKPKEFIDDQVRSTLLKDGRVYRISQFTSQIDLQNRQYNATIVLDTTEGLLEMSI